MMKKKKLILIYGHAATGKLTVARELQKITDYKLIHNHMSANIASKIFNFGTDEFDKLNTNMQNLLLKATLESDVDGVIFTKVYNHSKHKKFLDKLKQVASKNGFIICSAKLEAQKNIVLKRVKSRSRKKEGKLRDKKPLAWSLNNVLLKKIPGTNSILIDNTKLSAKKVAHRIKEEFKL